LVALGQSDGTFSTPSIASNSFTPLGEGWSSNDRYPRQVADVNGDGQADIIGFANSAVLVALGQSDGTFGSAFVVHNGFTSSGGTWSNFDRQPRQIADVNGDGQADIIGFGESQVNVSLSVSVDDNLIGGAGDDRLVGGAGNDILTGGANADTFVFSTNAASGGIDRITDFNAMQGDIIEIDQAVFGVTSLSDISFNSSTGELFVGGTYNNTLAILTGPSGFDVNNHINLISTP
ncbi:FG-GAP-like repeat-containing protein, partial [Acaryochloris marina NIES-2412]|uniref:FG-GAP-like repeat-containing protein n=1 Tax=Acaryochloris marina TaxID=155978 RepID=UPI00405903FA